uniref:Uncharacterized protein n=1 Tax=Rhizophora mucronata TaxID=61149 RepID=A0A2P2Q0E5_RHIMU
MLMSVKTFSKRTHGINQHGAPLWKAFQFR